MLRGHCEGPVCKVNFDLVIYSRVLSRQSHHEYLLRDKFSRVKEKLLTRVKRRLRPHNFRVWNSSCTTASTSESFLICRMINGKVVVSMA